MSFEKNFLNAKKYRNVQWPPESFLSLLSKIAHLLVELDTQMKQMFDTNKD